ncbi:MAG: aldehyde ferredoxin oxidoreductase N-terminal domain-containing protein, partial [Promethearchaeota archaeon]
MTYAYTGKILWVDLSSNKFTEENVPEDIYRKYLGGYGLGVYYIYKNIQPDCDPMGPENILGFVPGALTGSPAPLTGRFMVCGKSPLTGKGLRSDGTMSKGGWGDSNCGGFFGPAIRRSGYDAIFIKGQSENPVYLVIDDNRKELVPAGELWGIDAVETEKKLKESLGKGYQVSCIGQAGENKSLIAGIVNDGGRIAARSGLGAVMGSKKLKAIALKGKTKVEFADRKALNEIIKPYNKRIKKLMKPGIVTGIVKQVEKMGGIMRKIGMKLEANIPIADRVMVQMYGTAALGTPSTTWVSVETGDAPIKNFKGVGYKDYPKKQAWNVSGNKARTYMKKQYGCFGCPVRCGAILKYDDLEYEDKETHRPEYETMAAFGSMLLNPDLGTVIKCNEFLNR